MAARTANALWEGSLREGRGQMSLGSGAFEGAYSFTSRFEEGESGTNPEELVAAAHAGCFSMQLSGVLNKAGHEPESVETEATVHLDKGADGFSITRIELRTRGRVPNIDADEFRTHAETAKEICPVSRALGGVGSIEVEAELLG